MDDVMSEIARQATICKVKLLDPGVIDAVIRNDESVCGTSNPLSFKKLRNAMLMGFVVKGKSVDALGPVETEGLITAIRERIKLIWAISWVAPPERRRERRAQCRKRTSGDLYAFGAVAQ
jgi:hypothetical protein